MRMPNKEDETLLKTLKIGVNPAIQAKLEQQLYLNARKQDDAESCFSLALYHCILIPTIKDGQKQHKCLMDTIEWASRTVEKDKDHWPALFLRSMVRLMMNDEADEMAMYLLPMDFTEEDVMDDIDHMIEMQMSMSQPSSYCAVPYVELAYAKMLDEDPKAALEVLNNASEHIKLEKMEYFADVLRLPFMSLYKKAFYSHSSEILKVLKPWISVLFPSVKFRTKGEK